MLLLEELSRRSTITLFRSMETTSPVSSSTKSSTHVESTLAANLRPTAFLRLALLTFTSSARSKISRICWSAS